MALTTPGYLHRGLDELFRMAREDPLTPRCTRFFFVRHGETDGNHARLFQTAEQPLNARGLAQAEAASDVLKGERVERIVSSTMPRAWVTAEVIGRPHSVAPEPEDGLRERWFGDLVGTSSADHDWRDAPPNGEALDFFVRRARRGIERGLSLRTPSIRQWWRMAAFSMCSDLHLASILRRITLPMRRPSSSSATGRSGVRAASLI